ncbi:MAG TPA: hypothetical protein DCX37_10830 [Firmicutes bacterium]|nr:hypothetical protein [Bacillota bacterium]HAW71656.1 hypothetical protein [Bacillota bacterium]HCF91755.1 hypothetical protein [Bacillota bacterium]HCT35847.1 hypothetical protein [Bacillota bacterium]
MQTARTKTKAMGGILMTEINCSVKHCIHNLNNKEMCELKSIMVIVPERKKGTDDSGCGDFEPAEGSLEG